MSVILELNLDVESIDNTTHIIMEGSDSPSNFLHTVEIGTRFGYQNFQAFSNAIYKFIDEKMNCTLNTYHEVEDENIEKSFNFM